MPTLRTVVGKPISLRGRPRPLRHIVAIHLSTPEPHLVDRTRAAVRRHGEQQLPGYIAMRASAEVASTQQKRASENPERQSPLVGQAASRLPRFRDWRTVATRLQLNGPLLLLATSTEGFVRSHVPVSFYGVSSAPGRERQQERECCWGWRVSRPLEF
jgi:hypothetical protein